MPFAVASAMASYNVPAPVPLFEVTVKVAPMQRNGSKKSVNETAFFIKLALTVRKVLLQLVIKLIYCEQQEEVGYLTKNSLPVPPLPLTK